MPLTFAHPVAVLPLKRFGLPLSALVVGSMAPDLEYLLRLAPRSEFSHTTLGLFWFCIPVGMFFLWLFHQIWKQPMIALLGDDAGATTGNCAQPFAFWPLRRFVTLCVATLVGSLTHVAWDSFTHQYGWMIQKVPALSYRVLQTSLGAVPLFKILQHGSTLVGLTVLGYLALRDRTWIRRISVDGWKILAVICCTSVAGGVVIAFLKTGSPLSFRGAQRLVGMSVVAVSAVLVAEITLVSLLWHFRERNCDKFE